MMDRPLVRIGGYVLFGVVSFIVALLVTFPDGAIKQIAAVQIEHQLEKSMQKNYEVEVGDLDLWWIGLELEDLSISERKAEAIGADKNGNSEGSNGNDTGDQNNDDGEEAEPSLDIMVPSIGARFAPISSLLSLGLSGKFHLGLGGGSLSGSYTRTTSSQSMHLSINDLTLDQSPILVQFTGVPMFGTLSGSGDFQFEPNRPVVTGGSFQLTGEKITIGPKQELKLEAIPFGHVNIPQTNFGNMELKLDVEKQENGRPRVTLEEWRSEGRDLQLQIWGHVQLADRAANADSRLKLRVRLNPEFINKNKAIQGMIRNEKMQNGQDGDWHGLVFWGALDNLQWKGSPTAARGPESDGDKGGDDGDGQKAPKKAPKKGKKK